MVVIIIIVTKMMIIIIATIIIIIIIIIMTCKVGVMQNSALLTIARILRKVLEM